jgi:hypothetical protein
VVIVEQTVSVKKDAKREIIGLALLLEDVSDLTVFVRYHGHVQSVSLEVVKADGLESEKELIRGSFYTDFRHGTDEQYEVMKSFLQSKIEEYTAI